MSRASCSRSARAAAEREDVLWDPPPPPGEQPFGWFAYAPSSGEAYRRDPTLPAGDPDEPDRRRD